AIDAAGSELMKIEAESIATLSMTDRLKLLEEKIVHYVHDLLHFDDFEIRLIDPDNNRLELVMAVGITPERIGEVLYPELQGSGITGYVAASGESYLCPRVKADPLYREGLDDAASSLTVPLRLHDRIIGVFNVESKTPDAFDENDRQFATIFGRYIAMAMNILNLLVVERYTTNEQVAQTVLGELSEPLTDITQLAESLREANLADGRTRKGLDRIMEAATKIRRRVEACAAGPRTILGAEQELHRDEPDPAMIGKRVLIADDDAEIRTSVCAILTHRGCDVTVCGDGGQTIEVLRAAGTDHAPFDLIISDIKMPDRSGYEVFRAAKETSPDTPVILMTGFGYDPHHSIVRASQEGLQSFLFKPFKASQLVDEVKRALSPPEADRTDLVHTPDAPDDS
ncbi:MAG: GAF domain-containing protein, partial [Planctomycetota bacterium]